MPLHLCCISALLLAPPSADVKPVGYARPQLLVEASELAKPEAARQYRILDARPKSRYEAGHIPGAVWLDVGGWSRAFGDGRDVVAWGKRIGALGIDGRTRVVVYGDAATPEPARAWWLLRYWGVGDVRLLNGGWRAWHEAGGPVSNEVPQVPAKEFLPKPSAERLATKGQILDWLAGRQFQILDTRSRAEYCGDAATAKRNGAIPGAVHLEWIEVIDPKTQRFRSAAELAKLFKDRGIDLGRPAVTHCQSGGRAAVMAFALEMMGAKDVRNYYKSWAEWGNDPATPVVKPQD